MNRTTRIVALVVTLGVWTTALEAQVPARRVNLAEALRLFAANNLDLRVARYELAESRGDARQAGAFPNPTLSVTHEPLSDGATEYSESYFNLSQRFELPGRRSARTEEQVWAVRAREARLSADSARLAFAVKEAYVEAVLAEELLSVVERVAGVFREAARSAAVREAEGDISRYDLRRITVERARYENLLADAQIRRSSAGRKLALLILPESDAVEVFPAGLDEDAPPEPTLGSSAEEWSARRQEIVSAEADVEAAHAAARFRRAARLPDFTATGGFKRQSDGFNGVFLGLSIPLPLFDRKRGAIDAAEAHVGTLETRLGLTQRQVENDLRRAIESYESLKRRAEVRGDGVLEASSDLLEIAQVAYDLGEMGLLEILDAAEALRGAQNASFQLKADLWTAYYDLERATGGFAAAPQPATTNPEVRS